MTLTELRQEVYTLTNRPALVAETLTAIRSATLAIHQSDYFYKDLFETGVSFLAPAFTQQIDYRSLIPKWRAFKYLRKTDSTGQEQGQVYRVITPEEILDQYQTNQTDVCYVAGSVIQIRSATELQYAMLGCYVQPEITESGYNSWVAIDHPYAIVFAAAATVFKAIGDTEKFAAYTQLANMQMAEVKMSNIQAYGY